MRQCQLPSLSCFPPWLRSRVSRSRRQPTARPSGLFTLFPSLPPELRLKIWRAALGSTERLVHLCLRDNYDEVVRYQNNEEGTRAKYYVLRFEHMPEPEFGDEHEDEHEKKKYAGGFEESVDRIHRLSLVCVEAREVVLAAYPKTVIEYFVFKPPYPNPEPEVMHWRRALRFNPETDIVDLSSGVTYLWKREARWMGYVPLNRESGVGNFFGEHSTAAPGSFSEQFPRHSSNDVTREALESFSRVIFRAGCTHYCLHRSNHGPPGEESYCCLKITKALLMLFTSVKQVYLRPAAGSGKTGGLRARWSECDASPESENLVLDDHSGLTHQTNRQSWEAAMGEYRASWLRNVPSMLGQLLEDGWADTPTAKPRDMPRIGLWLLRPTPRAREEEV
ncbi:hypothetical protein GGR56DRAFT_628393 [Xylariaceae sp. FL0804]|nr:hypothetical protein GGR56DRAFT_628393 [Xylariaceae sp. FL0804]